MPASDLSGPEDRGTAQRSSGRQLTAGQGGDNEDGHGDERDWRDQEERTTETAMTATRTTMTTAVREVFLAEPARVYPGDPDA